MLLPSANSSQLQLLINFLPVTHGAQARRGGRLWGWVGHTCFQFPGKFGGWKPKLVPVPRITSAKPGPRRRCEHRSAKCKDIWAGVLETIQTPATVQFAQHNSTFIKYYIGVSKHREAVPQYCQWFALGGEIGVIKEIVFLFTLLYFLIFL